MCLNGPKYKGTFLGILKLIQNKINLFIITCKDPPCFYRSIILSFSFFLILLILLCINI